MLRKRKNKRYNEEANDEEGGKGRRYDIKDKIRSERFERLRDLQEVTGDKVTLKMIQRNGFDKPILVASPEGLDLTVPSKGFVVRDVGKLVGYDRMIDVMDVGTQKNIEMSMRDWCKYYESRNKDRLLNVISLEFSHTELASQVESPKIVKLLDWVDLVWPKFLKESQTESTNSIDKMKYPKVQKYCLMSVKGSYTDFHIDFGGTSVWYHILRGKKIFWMAPPTELNLQAFEEWTLSGMQQDVFFGDTVEECFRVELTAGNTFFIPSGWIHAVYTLEDSLVFGGNFLHSFGIENQLKVSRIEDATKVPVKFRYPFYTEILWYVVQHYVYCLTGKSHLQNSPKNSVTTTPEKNSKSIVESKETKKRSKIVDDSETESEHDNSDITKGKKAASPLPLKKTRGRPSRQKSVPKPPTDDESTEIDSEYEDLKPAKSSTTCRMTKNSLLRLQYELDEPQSTPDRNQSSLIKNNKSLKNEKAMEESSKKAKSTTNSSPRTVKTQIKTEISPNSELQSIPNNPEQTKAFNSEASNNLLSNDAAKLNGWTGANKSIWSNSDSEPKGPIKIHITKTELNGLKLLVKHLSKLSGAKKNMPNLIRNSRALLDDCKKVIAEHENDDSELSVTGVPITPELLNPKKSDINQLIEQFFKPSDSVSDETSANNTMSPSKFKSDSSTLTMQHRLKYNQISNLAKLEESASLKTPGQRDAKTPISIKKSSNSLSPTLSSANNSSSIVVTSSADKPRPKSPPTRPLSNKQYSSRTKGEKADNSLVLPGSFADLIAATSTEKEVFNVSSADVTSSLFGLKSPAKNSFKDRPPANSNNSRVPKKSSFDIDSILPSTNSDNSNNQKDPKDNESPKSISPEPPKLTPPAKRFITPTQNRLQVKEKLIFASAPYVSPASLTEHSRSSYMWQSSSKPQISYHNSQPHQQYRQTQQYPPNYSSSSSSRSNEQPMAATPPANQSVSGRLPPADHIKPASNQQTHKIDTPSDEVAIVKQVQQSEVHKSTGSDTTSGSTSAKKLHDEPVRHSEVSDEAVKNDEKHAGKTLQNNIPAPTPADTPAATVSVSTAQSTANNEDQKVKKPRGPPKKSKEARQVIEQSFPEPVRQAVPISVIKLNTGGQLPVVVQSTPPVTDPPRAESPKETLNSKEKIKSKSKRVKKQNELGAASSSADKSGASSLQPIQTRPPVICGLVAPTTTQNSTTTNTPPQPPKAGQQYLISRPVLFNTMPTFSSAHLPQMPPTSMPLFTTSMPTSMGLHNMQPRARILWATRPQAPTPVSSAPVVPSPNVLPTQPKKKVQKPTTPMAPTNLQVRQPDNAALLSLATTALSTAPLPTTPTLSTIGARLPNPAQAYMVNPNLFAAQQYYNPYMQQIPMVQFAAGDTNQAAFMAGPHFRPAPQRPAGRLLFAPLVNQTGPRYLITQPGFMPRPQAAPLYSGHQPPSNISFAAFQPTSSVPPSSSKESAKVKKVKTR